MIVLDTNVLSALMRQQPEQPVIDWLDRQPWTSVWTTSITILEIRFGPQTLPLGKRRSHLIATFEKVILEKLERRIAAFDRAAADEAAVGACAHSTASPVPACGNTPTSDIAVSTTSWSDNRVTALVTPGANASGPYDLVIESQGLWGLYPTKGDTSKAGFIALANVTKAEKQSRDVHYTSAARADHHLDCAAKPVVRGHAGCYTDLRLPFRHQSRVDFDLPTRCCALHPTGPE